MLGAGLCAACETRPSLNGKPLAARLPVHLCALPAKDTASAPVGQQKDVGGTVLRLLKQVVAVPQLKLGTHAKYIKDYPFLKLYWA